MTESMWYQKFSDFSVLDKNTPANAHLYNTDARTDGNCSLSIALLSTVSWKDLHFIPEVLLDFTPKDKTQYADEEKSCVPNIPYSENSSQSGKGQWVQRTLCSPVSLSGMCGGGEQLTWAYHTQDVLPTCTTSSSAPRKSHSWSTGGKICDYKTSYFCIQAQAETLWALLTWFPRIPQANQVPLHFIHFYRGDFPCPDWGLMLCVMWHLNFFDWHLKIYHHNFLHKINSWWRYLDMMVTAAKGTFPIR